MTITEVGDAWCIALESGKYEQCYNHFFRGGKYCCLGVLCQIAVEAGVIKTLQDGWRDDDKRFELTNVVRKWAGLNKNTEDQFTGMNDIQKLPFTEIAVQIRAMPNKP